MTVRVTLLAVLAAALGPPVAAQIPDSLAHLGLPDNPLEFARKLAREVRDTGGYRSVRVFDMYRAGGCVSDGGWTAAAFEEMYRLAEADPLMLSQVAETLGLSIGGTSDVAWEVPCLTDLPGFELWLTGALRRRWEAGALSSPGHGLAVAATSLVMALANAQDPDAHALIEAIALDADVDDRIRYDATMAMMRRRASLRGSAGMTDEDANELRLDVVERMVREHLGTLPLRWIRESLPYLRGNGKISQEEHLELLLRLHDLTSGRNRGG